MNDKSDAAAVHLQRSCKALDVSHKSQTSALTNAPFESPAHGVRALLGNILSQRIINIFTRAVKQKTAMGSASTLPNVCDEARLLVIEVFVMTTLQLSQLVSPLEAEESPNPINERT